MSRKILSILMMLALFMQMSIGVFAAGESNVTFDGEAKDFIFLNGNTELFDNFKNLMPGETRSQTITLKNDDYEQMKFYLSAKVSEEMGAGGIVFEITLKKDGKEFYKGKIGGLESFGEGYMADDFLLESLPKGGTADIDLEIYVDGDSMDNSYQNTEGVVNFIFSVSRDENANQTEAPSTEKPSGKNPGGNNGNSGNQNSNTGNQNGGSGSGSANKTVKTGDESPIIILGVSMLVCIWIIIAAAKKRSKSVEEES